MKNILEGTNSRLHEAEGRISDLEDKRAENIQSEHEKEKEFLKNEHSVRDLQDNIKVINISITGVT